MVRGHRRRRWAWALSVLLAAGVAFKLFEPVLVWGYGWQPLPVDEYPSVTATAEA